MRICGIKLTHDSSISVIEDGKLISCIELEKLNNNNRYRIVHSLEEVGSVLRDIGHPIESMDKIAIDGWVGLEQSFISLGTEQEIQVAVAPYHEASLGEDLAKEFSFSGLNIGGLIYEYSSYTHALGHLLSAYCTSPFALKAEGSFVLIWDGGMYPRLYYYNGTKVTCMGPLFSLGVNIYSIFSQHFGPFKINENVIKDELSIAGKIMAYTSYGKISEEILTDLWTTLRQTESFAKNQDNIPSLPYHFSRRFLSLVRKKNFLDEDIIATFHFFLSDLLIETLKMKVQQSDLSYKRNLCISGGAALNIKWNSDIRKSGIFESVWVPPFPNDSGSSFGTALGAWVAYCKEPVVEWSVYQGPQLIKNEPIKGWSMRNFSLRELALLLFLSNEPIVLLDGCAELGPRALGKRSILASPVLAETKDKLNFIKIREYFRPVAPICLEHKASEVFDPGCPDPYMVFEHQVKPKWRKKIPAVVHVDNSARVQTVNRKENSLLFELLSEFEIVSGVPVLCNTSANFKGSGFFPDIKSASRWSGTNYIWCHGKLIYKNNSLFESFLERINQQ